ncbi:MAG: CDP-glucose 4,6-dehydratase [Rhodospirillaceae bacterium]|jgi:CDP-glucose 4,6-dehydratase|nr:CDP-glucose 4,6-dehydratase [Rhodospirillaceae bacterium]
MGVDRQFWANKTVLVTGHTGFKGAWLCLWLQKMGATVVGYALDAPTKPNLFSVADVERGMTSITGDIRDIETLQSVMSDHKPEIVFHMAAQSLVRYSYEAPLETYSTNVMGAVNLLEAVRLSHSVKSVVVVTSDKCYENKEWDRGYQEDDVLGGRDPYSNSKGCAELVTSAYRQSFFESADNSGHPAAVASARAGNVVGGGDWAQDRLIPDAMRAFTANRAMIVRSPNAIRPWQHVLEPLAGYILLAQNLFHNGADFAQAWNFGPPESDVRSVSMVLQTLRRLWGEDVIVREDINETQVHEAQTLKLDSAKAAKLLNWRPRLSLEDGLGFVVDWYRSYKNDEDMRAFTIRQIEIFENKDRK